MMMAYHSGDDFMHTIEKLAHLTDNQRSLGYARIGRLLKLSLERQGLTNNKAVHLLNRIYRSPVDGIQSPKIQPGHFGKYLKGHIAAPSIQTLRELAVLCYKPEHFLINGSDQIGQPIIKQQRHTDRYTDLIYGTANKVDQLPNHEQRCTVDDLLAIILNPPLLVKLSDNYSGRTPMFI
jgi:hypothetical protein